MTEKHKAEVALRKAAQEFAAALHAPIRDAHDSEFQKVDAKLMKAAIRYADARDRGTEAPDGRGTQPTRSPKADTVWRLFTLET